MKRKWRKSITKAYNILPFVENKRRLAKKMPTLQHGKTEHKFTPLWKENWATVSLMATS